MSGRQYSITPYLGAPMQINHIIMSLLPLQWLILASGRARELSHDSGARQGQFQRCSMKDGPFPAC